MRRILGTMVVVLALVTVVMVIDRKGEPEGAVR